MRRHEFYPAPILIVNRGEFLKLPERLVNFFRVGEFVAQVLNVKLVVYVETHFDV